LAAAGLIAREVQFDTVSAEYAYHRDTDIRSEHIGKTRNEKRSAHRFLSQKWDANHVGDSGGNKFF
jgi:hypothetical protein